MEVHSLGKGPLILIAPRGRIASPKSQRHFWNFNMFSHGLYGFPQQMKIPRKLTQQKSVLYLYLVCLFTYCYRYTVYVVYYIYILILCMFVIFVCNSCLCIPYIYLYPYFCSCAKCGISWHISCISRGNQQTDFKKQTNNLHIPTQSTFFLRFFQLISPSPSPIFLHHKKIQPFSNHKKSP